MTGSGRLAAIRDAVGGRKLVWFGTRGVDARPLSAISRPIIVTSQIAPLVGDDAVGTEQDCLETRTSSRVDLDRYDIDFDASPRARGLKTQFLARMDGPLIIAAYRPAEFLAASGFCESQLVSAFNFHLLQRQFEHKPWVERLLRRFDPELSLLPTRFIRDTDVDQLRRLLQQGPQVGRTTSSTGGAGVFLIESENDFLERLPPHRDGFVGLTPYYAEAVPLNVNACVYGSGDVAVFGVSFQLIGVPGLTARRFGFCGNDFAAAAALDTEELDCVEHLTARVGACLARTGYRGVFGLDLLRVDGRYLVVELNARFQASTALSSEIDQALRLADPMTEHIAAFLDMTAPITVTCAERTRAAARVAGSVAQVFHRNLLLDSVHLDSPPKVAPGQAVDALAGPATVIEGGALLFRSLHRQQVTWDGYSVSTAVSELARTARLGF